MSTTLQIERPIARTALTALGGVFRRNRLLPSLVLLYILAGAALSYFANLPFWEELIPGIPGVFRVFYTMSTIIVFLLGTLLFAWRFIYAATKARPKSPIRWLITDLRDQLARRVRIVDGVISLAAIGLMIATFSCLKNFATLLVPFSWDPAFAEMDRALHGGADVWTLTFSVFGSPYVTTGLSVAYHMWFPLLYILIFYAALNRRNPAGGMVYLIAFMLTYVLGGNVLATLLSSAGPVYYQEFGFGDTYVPQMESLRQMHEISPVWVLEVQEKLLNSYYNGGFVRGISAMPSMHVASSVVMALYAFTISRWLGWIFTIFAAAIMVGSVHLAWHYAVDGYVGAAVALLSWWLAKLLVRKFYAPSVCPQSVSRAT